MVLQGRNNWMTSMGELFFKWNWKIEIQVNGSESTKKGANPRDFNSDSRLETGDFEWNLDP